MLNSFAICSGSSTELSLIFIFLGPVFVCSLTAFELCIMFRAVLETYLVKFKTLLISYALAA